MSETCNQSKAYTPLPCLFLRLIVPRVVIEMCNQLNNYVEVYQQCWFLCGSFLGYHLRCSRCHTFIVCCYRYNDKHLSAAGK